MTTSWPIGYASCFQSSLTGADNARFIARVYKRPEQELLDYVEDFAQLGAYFRQPVKTYSAGMAARSASASARRSNSTAIWSTKSQAQATSVFGLFQRLLHLDGQCHTHNDLSRSRYPAYLPAGAVRSIWWIADTF
jgi:hypothetical protein